MCSNYPEQVQKHPTHLYMCCSCRFDVQMAGGSSVGPGRMWLYGVG